MFFWKEVVGFHTWMPDDKERSRRQISFSIYPVLKAVERLQNGSCEWDRLSVERKTIFRLKISVTKTPCIGTQSCHHVSEDAATPTFLDWPQWRHVFVSFLLQALLFGAMKYLLISAFLPISHSHLLWATLKLKLDEYSVTQRNRV